ncbi:hypothetical protein ATCC90586_003471 [Pythium insidiosum]|nr:hypothetical protein ATCC90586_003471 [Pythium insidiosum]
MTDRMKQVGFKWSTAEDYVAAGQKTVADVMKSWMNSSGHRQNILGQHKFFGMVHAVASSDTYGVYWTQNFGSADGESCEGGSNEGGVQSTPAPYPKPTNPVRQRQPQPQPTPAPQPKRTNPAPQPKPQPQPTPAPPPKPDQRPVTPGTPAPTSKNGKKCKPTEVYSARHCITYVAVKEKYKDSHLAGIAASDLKVFASKAAFDAKQTLPKSSSPVVGLGNDKDIALIVQTTMRWKRSSMLALVLAMTLVLAMAEARTQAVNLTAELSSACSLVLPGGGKQENKCPDNVISYDPEAEDFIINVKTNGSVMVQGGRRDKNVKAIVIQGVDGFRPILSLKDDPFKSYNPLFSVNSPEPKRLLLTENEYNNAVHNLMNASLETIQLTKNCSTPMKQGYVMCEDEDASLRRTESFISSDPTLRAFRLEPSEVSVTKAIGAGPFWLGQYAGAKVVINRVEAVNHDSQTTKALRAHAQGLTAIQHRSIVAMMGVTWIEGTDFGVVAEFMARGPLKAVLMDSETKLDQLQRVTMCLEVANALAYLHSPLCDKYMRRLSSRKVLVSDALQCKLNLFECVPLTTPLDAPQIVGAGELAWFAPEVVMASSSRDARKANVFSLGVLLCEVLTNATPYEAEIEEMGFVRADLELLRRIKAKQPLVPHENHPVYLGLCSELRQLIERCLSYDPAHRPTAQEVADSLERCKGTLESRAFL